MIRSILTDKNEGKLWFLNYESKLKLHEAAEGEELSKLVVQDEGSVIKIINTLIFKLQASLNIANKLNEWQTLEISKNIVSEYPSLKLDELVLIFNSGKKGKFGTLYNMIDSTIIFNWIKAYLGSEERAAFFEKKNSTPKSVSTNITIGEIINIKAEDGENKGKSVLDKMQENTALKETKKMTVARGVIPTYEDYLKELPDKISKFSDAELRYYIAKTKNSNFREAMELALKEQKTRVTP